MNRQVTAACSATGTVTGCHAETVTGSSPILSRHQVKGNLRSRLVENKSIQLVTVSFGAGYRVLKPGNSDQ